MATDRKIDDVCNCNEIDSNHKRRIHGRGAVNICTIAAVWTLLTTAFDVGSIAALDVDKVYRNSTHSFLQQLDVLATRCTASHQQQGSNVVRRWAIQRDARRQYFFTEAATPSPRVPDVNSSVKEDSTPSPSFDWQTEFTRLREQRATDLFELANTALQAGNASRAYLFLFEVLRENSQHSAARKMLGYRHVNGNWYTPFAARMIAQGKIDHPEFGWLARKHVRRYKAGQRRYRGRWVSVKEADRLRGRMSNGWRITTDHYEVHTNHSLTEAVTLGRKLESLHSAWRQAFVHFYTTDEQLARRFRGEKFPLTPVRKFKVVFFRNRDEYVKHLKRYQPRIDLTLGIYLSQQRAAYFYAGDDVDDATLYHEATHQLFHEIGIAERRILDDIGSQYNFWIIEGIALFMESLQRHDSYLTLGGVDAARLQYSRHNVLSGNFYVPLKQFTSYSRHAMQSDDRIRLLYGQAAGTTHFLMQYDRGRYRTALIDYLKNVYRKRDKQNTLADLTGQQFTELDKEYRTFLNVNDDDMAHIRKPLCTQRLLLGQTEITDRGIGFLAGAKNLVELDIRGTKISDDALKVIGQFQQLQELDLSETAITNDGLRHLRNLRQLRLLSISATPIDNRGLTHLTNLTQLEELHIDGTQVTSTGLQTLRQSIPALQ